MSRWVVASGLLAGVGSWLAFRELWPAGPSLRAALDRLDGGPVVLEDPGAGRLHRLGARVAAAAPWLPVPRADLCLLGQHASDWLARKVVVGVVGMCLAPAGAGLAARSGPPVGSTMPGARRVAARGALFF